MNTLRKELGLRKNSSSSSSGAEETLDDVSEDILIKDDVAAENLEEEEESEEEENLEDEPEPENLVPVQDVPPIEDDDEQEVEVLFIEDLLRAGEDREDEEEQIEADPEDPLRQHLSSLSSEGSGCGLFSEEETDAGDLLGFNPIPTMPDTRSTEAHDKAQKAAKQEIERLKAELTASQNEVGVKQAKLDDLAAAEAVAAAAAAALPGGAPAGAPAVAPVVSAPFGQQALLNKRLIAVASMKRLDDGIRANKDLKYLRRIEDKAEQHVANWSDQINNTIGWPDVDTRDAAVRTLGDIQQHFASLADDLDTMESRQPPPQAPAFPYKEFAAVLAQREDDRDKRNRSKDRKKSCKLADEKLELFGGDVCEFHNWVQTFRSMVHDRDDLSDIAKMRYLRNGVKGEAKEAIAEYIVRDENYKPAFDRLIKRFGNEEKLKTTTFARLAALEPAKHGYKEGRTMTGKLRQLRANLASSGVKVDSPDVAQLLLPQFLSKMSPAYIESWQRWIKGDGTGVAKTKSLENFFEHMEFLIEAGETAADLRAKPSGSDDKEKEKKERQSRADKEKDKPTATNLHVGTSDPAPRRGNAGAIPKRGQRPQEGGGTPRREVRQQMPPQARQPPAQQRQPLGPPLKGPTPAEAAAAAADSAKRPCCFCLHPSHHGPTCEKGKKMTVDQRWIMAKEAKICFRCLRGGHQSPQCPEGAERGPCGLNGCGYNHHQLLHQGQQ